MLNEGLLNFNVKNPVFEGCPSPNIGLIGKYLMPNFIIKIT